MIDFKKELEAILNNDPLDILKSKPKVSSVISTDNRLKDSFEAINEFLDIQGHEPTKSRDINERRLFSRLQGFRESPEKAAMVLELDKHNLLTGVEAPEPFIIESIDDVIDTDPLGLLGNINNTDEVDIFNLQNLPSKSRALTDFMARRKPCEDFKSYKEQLIKVQTEIRENKRKLKRFTDKGEAIVEGNYYILGGILLYLDSIYFDSEEESKKKSGHKKDGRTRCIFENGTESNMLYRSLAKALYHGGKIVSPIEEQINKVFQENLGTIKNDDELAGFIYILKSSSQKAEIQNIQDLYKVGFSTIAVQKRIANAEKEPTYLMSPVKLVAEYEAYNMNTQKFEHLLHKFLADVCLDIDVADNNGKTHKPREWFIAPLGIIYRAIELIATQQIQHYQYDAKLKQIVVG
jgi:hypothetical protein